MDDSVLSTLELQQLVDSVLVFEVSEPLAVIARFRLNAFGILKTVIVTEVVVLNELIDC